MPTRDYMVRSADGDPEVLVTISRNDTRAGRTLANAVVDAIEREWSDRLRAIQPGVEGDDD